MPDDDLLRLIALDPEDLAVVSAHVQDAVLKVKDILWLSNDRHLVMGLNRFVWVSGPRRKREHQRRRAVLHLARVEKVQSAGVNRERPDDVLELLAVRFEPGDSPSGEVILEFAGGAALRLKVEVLEVKLTDLGPAWSTPHAPRHVLA